MANTQSTNQHNRSEKRREENGRATVTLPYSISNIVFLESLPFWASFILSVIMFVFNLFFATGELALWGSASDNALIGSITNLLVSAAVLAAGWLLLWKWALHGYKIAVIVVYILYIPVIVIGIYFALTAVFAVFSAITPGSGGISQRTGFIIGAVVALFFAITFLVNVYEKGIRQFVGLRNRCPSCQRWRFGYIKRPTTVTCENCGTTIDFVRAN